MIYSQTNWLPGQIAAMEAVLTDDWQDGMSVAAKAKLGRSRVTTLPDVARKLGWGCRLVKRGRGDATKYEYRRKP